jgi:release factor glutamine methyltransferase
MSAPSDVDPRELVRRRAAHEPLAYILGRATFRGRDFCVDERVFIPRPETELLVEAALAIPRGARALEPCTGSGAVAIALALERPDLEVTGTDRSPEAIEVAGGNAAAHGAPVGFHVAEGIAGAPGGPYDAVVANPPYVPRSQAGTGELPPELELHEPPGAFWAGSDGLDAYRDLTRQLGGVGWVAFEVGDGQAGAVWALLGEAGLRPAGARRAPSGEIRVVVAERP